MISSDLDDGKWQKLTEEGRMTEIIKAIIYKQKLRSRSDDDAPRTNGDSGRGKRYDERGHKMMEMKMKDLDIWV